MDRTDPKKISIISLNPLLKARKRCRTAAHIGRGAPILVTSVLALPNQQLLALSFARQMFRLIAMKGARSYLIVACTVITDVPAAVGP
jgi:hypothetical protein